MTPEYPRNTSWQVRLIQLFVVVIVVILTFVALTSFARTLASGISNESTGTIAIEEGVPIDIEIKPGSTAGGIAAALLDAGVISDSGDFESAVTSRGVGNQLKAGGYTLISGSDHDELIDVLVRGPELAPVQQIRIIEGLTIDEILVSLSEQTGYTIPQLTAPLINGTIDSKYLPAEAPDGYPELVRWEGLLAPDTYEFREDASPADILGAMAKLLEERVSGMEWSALDALDLDPYDGLIIASLIEKEAKLNDERPIIASVIMNRLTDGIGLQIDATIIYALGENRGEVLTEDLRIDSPYNTYLYQGLPPTPIGGVRLASIEAAANPDSTDFYYYVLINSDGTHGFSETLEEHNRKKQEAKDAGVLTP